MSNSKTTNDTKKKVEAVIDSATEFVQDQAIEKYDEAIDRLKYEKDRLERELRHEYRNARKYVRANPEQGVGVAFVAGLIFGVLVARGGRN